MKKFLVIGNPIDHSLSPALHNFWIKNNGIDAIYEKQKLHQNELEHLILQIREKIYRAKRLNEAQLLATKNGEVTPYRRSVFEERIRQTQKEMKLKDSKN